MLLTALGLAGATGLSPWMPLLLTAGFGRLGWVELDPAWSGLTDLPVVVVLGVLFAADFAGDKVPVVDHALHVAGLAVAPAAGAVVFDAQAGAHVPLLVSLLAGGASAGVLHAARASVRPGTNIATGGFGAPVASLMEDAAAFLLVVVAFLLPLVAAAVVGALLVGGALALSSARRRRANRPAR